MKTFTIDTDNNITAHAAAPDAQDNLAAFASQKELSNATAEWPISRLVETWNSFAGTPGFDDLKPVKKYTDRKTAVTRIWTAIQKLEPAPAPQAATPAPQAASKPAKKGKATKATKAAADAPTPASDASTPRVPRAFSKQANRARHAAPHRRRRIAGNYGRDGLAKTHRQGLHQHPRQEDRDCDHQHPARERPGAGLRSRKVASQQGSRRERSWRLLTSWQCGTVETHDVSKAAMGVGIPGTAPPLVRAGDAAMWAGTRVCKTAVTGVYQDRSGFGLDSTDLRLQGDQRGSIAQNAGGTGHQAGQCPKRQTVELDRFRTDRSSPEHMIVLRQTGIGRSEIRPSFDQCLRFI